jgi:two-component system LytT family response regulator
MNIKTFLVDDEALSRQRMKALLAEHGDIEVTGEFASGAEAKVAIDARAPDMLFLDVQMPRMSGLKLAQLLGDQPLPLVVFVTAHESFAVEAFDTRAVDYLLKPVRQERLARTLMRVRDQLGAISETEGEKLPPPPPPSDGRASISRLMAKSGDRIVFIKAADIDWIESAGNYVIVHAGSERHIIRETMVTLERELSPDTFVRLNRSLIVNIASIVELEVQGPGEYHALLKGSKRANVTIGLRELESRLRFGH